jgi:hypothetical protein
VSITRGWIKFLQKYMALSAAHRLPIFSNPVLRVFSKYILAVMADKSGEELQRMECFTSRSDSDIDVVNLSFGQMGCFEYIHTHLYSYTV